MTVKVRDANSSASQRYMYRMRSPRMVREHSLDFRRRISVGGAHLCCLSSESSTNNSAARRPPAAHGCMSAARSDLRAARSFSGRELVQSIFDVADRGLSADRLQGPPSGSRPRAAKTGRGAGTGDGRSCDGTVQRSCAGTLARDRRNPRFVPRARVGVRVLCRHDQLLRVSPRRTPVDFVAFY